MFDDWDRITAAGHRADLEDAERRLKGVEHRLDVFAQASDVAVAELNRRRQEGVDKLQPLSGSPQPPPAVPVLDPLRDLRELRGLRLHLARLRDALPRRNDR